MRTRNAGADRFTFSGRLGGRRLAPGSHRFRATPFALDGPGGKTPTKRFRIVA